MSTKHRLQQTGLGSPSFLTSAVCGNEEALDRAATATPHSVRNRLQVIEAECRLLLLRTEELRLHSAVEPVAVEPVPVDVAAALLEAVAADHLSRRNMKR